MSRQRRDISRYAELFPILIDKMGSSAQDIRVAAMMELNFQVSAQFLGPKIDPFLNEFVEKLTESINATVRYEHDEAIGAACNLCLQRLVRFERYATVILNDLITRLSSCRLQFEFFGTAFLTVFGVENETMRQRVLGTFIDLLAKDSSSKRVEVLRALNIILSGFPPHTCAHLIDELTVVVDRCFESSNGNQIFVALETLLIVQDSLDHYVESQRISADTGDEVTTKMQQFISKYVDNLTQIHLEIQAKAERKQVKAKCEETKRLLDGQNHERKLLLNGQHVKICGARHICLVNAIERVTRKNFQEQMSRNTLIHELFGVQVRPVVQAVKKEPEVKQAVKTERTMTKKDREKERMKKRRQKADIMDAEDF